MGFRRSRRTNVGRPSNDIDSIGMNGPVAATEKNEMGNVALPHGYLVNFVSGEREWNNVFQSPISQPHLCDRPSCVFLRGCVLLVFPSANCFALGHCPRGSLDVECRATQTLCRLGSCVNVPLLRGLGFQLGQSTIRRCSYSKT